MLFHGHTRVSDFPIIARGILYDPVAVAQTISVNLSLDFFFHRMVAISSDGNARVYIGSSLKNRPVSSILYTFSGVSLAMTAYNSSNAFNSTRLFCLPQHLPSQQKFALVQLMNLRGALMPLDLTSVHRAFLRSSLVVEECEASHSACSYPFESVFRGKEPPCGGQVFAAGVYRHFKLTERRRSMIRTCVF
ncbi:hypothetical protein XU18_3812 [Perkinsela sp. CCAP 1560/4]|nr:hypothetical protein XU18_3812 [Perkinsela sp. CCAP 1560/4]|eukprot:KNH05084.1 hypothetical protein XU18_3812 [Perkinsela sp. CCAP 1560/4]